MDAVFWALWFLGCLLVAYWLIRAARDYRDDEPQPGPVWDADDQPSIRDDWAATWQRRYDLPDHDPNHRTTKGDQ